MSMNADHTHTADNAKAWTESIIEAWAACKRLDEGETEEETIDGQTYADREEIEDMMRESALEVSVRSDWHNPGETGEPTEYKVLLSTGGPALRIAGPLGLYGQPMEPNMQWQDWGTPWTTYTLGHEDEQESLEWFANLFYFGE
jgi:hypothetical protein